jgi:hypothetical protein
MCNVTLTAFVNEGHPQTVQIPTNKGAKMAVDGMREVEKVMLHCTRTDTIPTKGP